MSCAPRFSAHGRPAGRIQGAIASRGAAQAPEGSAMKPPAFDYHRPESVDETLALLANVGDDGKVLAGGQSLVPILNMRLASPVHLVDINRLADLAYVRAEPGGVRVGALARHADVERDAALALLREATACVAHAAVRNRGTSVGSLVHADPAAELAYWYGPLVSGLVYWRSSMVLPRASNSFSVVVPPVGGMTAVRSPW